MKIARTSKKKQEDKKAASLPAKIYSVGIYARLSVDTNERKNESVETQVEIAKAFVKQQKDMVIHDCYIDIGKTGTSFEREAFERMMQDVRMGKIDCIIVKDLSRFGRNHIEAGSYIEKIFPFMGVRFIAVTDNFDSMNIAGQNESMSINLKNLVNEMYARDIVVKVKSGKKAKWEQGSFTGGSPPYGYRAEWVGDRRRLFAEEITADIVRKIFELFLSGKNRKEIVVWLYEQGIVRPAEYHKTGEIFCRDREKLLQWSGGSIKMILTNPIYMGCLVQGRKCGKGDRIRSRQDMDSGDWAIKEHTHEAIISEDVFFRAAGKLEKASACCNKSSYTPTAPVKEDIFEDVLYCGNCGSKMKRTSGVRTYSYQCPKYSRIDGEKCVLKGIALQTLTELVKEALRQEFALAGICPKTLTEANIREMEELKKEWSRDLHTFEKQLDNLKKLGSRQYFKYRMGEVEKETFLKETFLKETFLKEREENAKKAALIQRMSRDISDCLRTIDALTMQKNHFLSALVKGNEEAELTGEVVRILIQRIEVYPDRRVRVIFMFQRKDIPTEREEMGRRFPHG